jgi:sugar phosphate isomerase/epimerase
MKTPRALRHSCGRTLGRETALGEGQVDFYALIQGLASLGYDGAITIEREIDGEQQIADIRQAKQQLLACIERVNLHKKNADVSLILDKLT